MISKRACETDYILGIDSKTASMYCFWCQDFIYDPFIEMTKTNKQAELIDGNGGSTILKMR